MSAAPQNSKNAIKKHNLSPKRLSRLLSNRTQGEWKTNPLRYGDYDIETNYDHVAEISLLSRNRKQASADIILMYLAPLLAQRVIQLEQQLEQQSKQQSEEQLEEEAGHVANLYYSMNTFRMNKYGDFLGTRILGKKAYHPLQLCLNKNVFPIFIDFNNVRGISHGFADEFIGEVIRNNDFVLKDKIKFINTNEQIKTILKFVISEAKR